MSFFTVIVNKKYFVFLLVSFSYFKVYAQQQELPLSQILAELQQRYEVTFTYADENVKGISIIPPAKNISLNEALEYLREATNLIFEQLNEQFIALRKPDSSLINLCAILIDSETKEPIVGAAIQVGNRFTTSNDTGYFELKRFEKEMPLLIQSLGYNALELKANTITGTPCGTILMKPQPLTLKEIIVTNYITEGINKKLDGTFEVRARNLGILPGLIEPDVLQTIQALPGIQSINETVSDINVRGGTNDQNLVLWDGIKMYQTGHFFGLISAYNPYMTDEVILIKNGTTAFLGDGVSSTIDIRSDNRLAEKFTGGGGLNLVNGDLYAKIPLSKKATVQLSTRRSISSILQTPTYNQYFDRAFRDTDVLQEISNGDSIRITTNENFDFYDVSVRFLYNISPKDRLNVNFLHVVNDIEYQENAILNNIQESKTSGLEQKSLASGLSYSRLWNEKVKSSVQLYLSSYQLQAVNFDVFNDQRLIQENKVLDTGFKLDTRLTITDHFDLFSGYQFFEIGVTNLEDINNPRFRRLIKKVNRSHVGFVEANYSSPSENTNIRLGLRTHYFPKFDEVRAEPRLAFTQKLLKNFTFEILGEFKNQITTQTIDFQNDFLGIEKRRWVLSDNQDTPIIRSKQISSGLHYQKEELLVSLEGYVKRVNGITSSSQGFLNQFQFVRSIGNYDASGLDLLISKRLNKFSTWISYSKSHNTFEFPDFEPSSFPNNLEIRHTIASGASYQSEHVQLSAGLSWHSGKPFTEPDGVVDNKIVYQLPNSSRLEDYLRLDFSAKYSFMLSKTSKGHVGVSLWNIFDKDNIVERYYRLENSNLNVLEQSALGITPNFTIRIFF